LIALSVTKRQHRSVSSGVAAAGARGTARRLRRAGAMGGQQDKFAVAPDSTAVISDHTPI
jgi:hypothetical protein